MTCYYITWLLKINVRSNSVNKDCSVIDLLDSPMRNISVQTYKQMVWWLKSIKTDVQEVVWKHLDDDYHPSAIHLTHES